MISTKENIISTNSVASNRWYIRKGKKTRSKQTWLAQEF